MVLVVVIIAVVALVAMFVLFEQKESKPLDEFSLRCHELLDDEHTSADLALIVRHVVAVVEDTRDTHPNMLKTRLEGLYQDAKRTPKFVELKLKIDDIFAAAERVIIAASAQ